MKCIDALLKSYENKKIGKHDLTKLTYIYMGGNYERYYCKLG